MAKTVIFLTSAYPFEGGEQFIESEILYWESYNINLIIMPMTCHGKPRKIARNASIDKCLYEQLTFIMKIKGVARALLSSFLFKEIFILIKEKKFNFKKVLLSLKAAGLSLSIASIVEERNKEYTADAIYSYWNGAQAFAGCILKSKGVIKEVYTRCHGYDLYEYRHHENYIPLKRVFNNCFDKWYVICLSAKEYLNSTFGVPLSAIELARLGVDVPKGLASTSPENVLHILSVSYCVEVKQIDKIIIALSLFAENQIGIVIKWTHIGAGPLLESLKIQANTLLESKNITFDFKGHLSNKAVKRFYIENDVDLFVNASESEGVPVSIMEAMSTGVPVIAPDVGGISELLELQECYLLPEFTTSNDIYDALIVMKKNCKNINSRIACKNKIIKEYNARKNFPEIIKAINND